MIELQFGEKYERPVSLALGFFDSLHKGHRELLSRLKEISGLYGFESAVMTFNNNPFQTIGKKTKLVYCYEERAWLLEKIGIDLIYSAPFDEFFMNMDGEDFLSILQDTLDIKHIVCGYDFRFGKGKGGDVRVLRQFCSQNGIGLDIVNKAAFDGKRISSTLIREYLSKGDIEKANELLEDPYFIMGKVVHGRKVGSKLLFPTINLEPDCQKLKIKQGVYLTVAEVDGVRYRSVTNYGGKPTFGLINLGLETYLIGYEGDLYGKRVVVSFIKRLRDIKRFNDPQTLKAQINKDIEGAKSIAIDHLQ